MKKRHCNRFIQRYNLVASNDSIEYNLSGEQKSFWKKDCIDKVTQRRIVDSLIRQFENRSMASIYGKVVNRSMAKSSALLSPECAIVLKSSLSVLQRAKQLEEHFAQRPDTPSVNINQVVFREGKFLIKALKTL